MTPLTIIIPTYNRPGYLRRILDYYELKSCPYDIIVADSSRPEVKLQNRTTVENHRQLNIRFLDSFSPDLNPWYKHPRVISTVTTEYLSFCADDDFILLDGIMAGLNFLKTNPDFVVAHGQYFDFHLKKTSADEPEFSWRLGGYDSPSVDTDEPAERLRAHLDHYNPTFYGVHRTAVASVAYRALLDFKVDPILFGELLSSAITVIYGKIKRLETPHSFSNGSSPTVWPDLLKLRREPSYPPKYATFRDATAHYLNQQSKLGAEQSNIIVDQAMKVYTKHNYPPNYRSKLRSLVKKALPENVYAAGRTLYRRSKTSDRSAAGQSLQQHQTEFDRKVKEIESLVLRDRIEIT
ncbi:MAG: hypothetical protein A3J59_03435 [Candidatus Buchananbacteria bacterium RIFCSPHIGHO2_02_FULL_56_16]|uniref:Glycosyltransferase 2-like domain-containing protein n=1 Tax=Candidatus Buchananbacteria bacterium RIFCSPHIGHO2_02_FULL_56_16 TaxID=1797542 RepID=A0A1G1YIK5_9BACT|nr:MAG: hypothetical protein A3J59_03435 [Candidatus Buchananbacteria bacterium RIFCSPHIGHO2_02_FULL_56_16]